MDTFNWLKYMWKKAFYCHCFFMSLEYHNILNFTTSGSEGSTSGKVAPSDISHVMKVINMRNQLKWNSYL